MSHATTKPWVRPAHRNVSAAGRDKMGFMGALFLMWLLLLPFSVMTKLLIGAISLDKAIAPVLLLMAFFTPSVLQRQRIGPLLIYLSLALLFIVTKNLSLFAEASVLWPTLFADATTLGYFMLPVLLIRTPGDLRRAFSVLVVIAIIGYLSAFLAATGMITLPQERFSESRFGLALPKTIGLFTAYGDLAQLSALVLGMIVMLPASRFFLRGGRWIKGAVLLCVAIGFVSCQSRNMIVASAVAVGTAYWLRRSLRRGQSAVTTLVSFSVAIAAAAVTIFLGTEFLASLSGLGGGGAARTAAARLEQYQMALDWIAAAPLLGVDAVTYARYGPMIDAIHNMWLALAAHGGLVAVMSLLALIFYSATGAFAYRKTDTPEEAIVILGYFAAMMVAVMFYPGQTAFFWVLLGVASSLRVIVPVEARTEARTAGPASG